MTPYKWPCRLKMERGQCDCDRSNAVAVYTNVSLHTTRTVSGLGSFECAVFGATKRPPAYAVVLRTSMDSQRSTMLYIQLLGRGCGYSLTASMVVMA